MFILILSIVVVVLIGCVEAQRQAAAAETATIAYGQTNVTFQTNEEYSGIFPGNIAPPPPYSGKQSKLHLNAVS